MDGQAELVEDDEEVDSDVDYVDDQAAEVHLSQGAEENRHVDQLVDALHQHDEAKHDRKCQVNESHHHEDTPVFFACFRWWAHRLAHISTAA